MTYVRRTATFIKISVAVLFYRTSNLLDHAAAAYQMYETTGLVVWEQSILRLSFLPALP